MATTKPFDPTKPVQTRNGHPVRIICTDFNRRGGAFDSFPILALVQCSFDHSGETVSYHTQEGRFWSNNKDHPFDLVNVPVRTSTWQNMYSPKRTGIVQPSREEADANVNRGDFRIGYLRRDFEDGVFVSAEFEPLTSEEE